MLQPEEIIEDSTKKQLTEEIAVFRTALPFNHLIIDNFLREEIAIQLSSEFPAYDAKEWYIYSNPIEEKRAINNWNAYPPLTYQVLSFFNSSEFIRFMSDLVGNALFTDNGLHGGGWHMHGIGGNLNPHVDYSIHPKLKLQRKLNLILYLSREIQQEHGGHLGLWASDPATGKISVLSKEIFPKFNRAVIFDTTQNSWHGMSRPMQVPDNIFRKSLAVYYLQVPATDASPRARALYAPRENQRGDKEIEELIAARADLARSASVYRIKDSPK